MTDSFDPEHDCQYEYTVVHTSEVIQKHNLAEQRDAGWELVVAFPDSTEDHESAHVVYTAVFRRLGSSNVRAG
ncbi:MAG: hypothetical protein GEU75_03665 [Dehalococcoidia bacterium]|nr:hypothetical protein [Dehalococcoidia bacterium]